MSSTSSTEFDGYDNKSLLDEFQNRSLYLKKVAFLSVALSTCAVAGCLVLFPMCFGYVHYLQAEVALDTEYCKLRARDLWGTMVEMDTSNADPPDLARVLGGWKAADPTVDASIHLIAKRQAFRPTMACCTCHRGPAGAVGGPGADGRAGGDGLNGRPGNPGPPSPNKDVQPNFPPQCPCESDPGTRGTPGNKGPPGNGGRPGQGGNPGNDGGIGRPGPGGTPGSPGRPGGKGNRGRPGGGSPAPGPPGRPGAPGTPGNGGRPGSPGEGGGDARPGDKGRPGDPGRRGFDGPPGGNGLPGQPGNPGYLGSCDHCPAARLAPGY